MCVCRLLVCFCFVCLFVLSEYVFLFCFWFFAHTSTYKITLEYIFILLTWGSFIIVAHVSTSCISIDVGSKMFSLSLPLSTQTPLCCWFCFCILHAYVFFYFSFLFFLVFRLRDLSAFRDIFSTYTHKEVEK